MPGYLYEIYQAATVIWYHPFAGGGTFSTMAGWIPVMLLIAFGGRVIDDILYG